MLARLSYRFLILLVSWLIRLLPKQPCAARTKPGTHAPECPCVALFDLPPRFGDFTILRRLGQGGMGTVYLALASTGERVALKVPTLGRPLSDRARRRFVREAKAAAAVRHPHVCGVLDVGEIDGIPYFTMPHVAGMTLADQLAEGGPLPQARCVELARKLASALDAAHRAGVTHRDVKPSNVLLDARGEPFLTDFGVAGLTTAVEELTEEGNWVGSLPYVAPEQLRGDRPASGPSSDVFSLGVVLYEMLTGRLPADAPSAPAMMRRILEASPPPPSTFVPLDAAVEVVCLRCLAKDPRGRYASMAELSAALSVASQPHPDET